MNRAKAARIAFPGTSVLDVLADERLRTLDLCRALHKDFLALVEATRSSNGDDEHDPKGATVAFERA